MTFSNQEINLEKLEIPKHQRDRCLKYLSWFDVEGKPANEIVTEGELKIFWIVVYRPKERAIIICSTQYGKSLFVALGCIIISCIFGEVVSVIAPTNAKAKIIMRYYIDHLGDNVLFHNQLEADTRLERLRKEESKERIILRNRGGIFIVSVEAGNTSKRIKAAMGYGCRNVVQDEGCQIPDDAEATVFRMIAGKGRDVFYCKIGNPFHREPPFGHFWDSWNDENYLKLFIDYQQGLEEGRYTESFIREAKRKPLFDILFECKFPDVDVMDKKGWMSLLTRKEIEMAMDGAEELQPFGEKAFGGDPADMGNDESVAVVRSTNLAKIEFANAGVDIMQFTGQSLLIIKEQKIKSANIFGDNIGVGAGYVSRLREQGQAMQGMNVAEAALDQRNFVNKKAENYWKLRQNVKEGLKLFPDERWFQLCNIKYRAKESDGRMEIMSKQEMRALGLPSPDTPEALMLTYSKPVRVFQPSYEEKFFRQKMQQKKLKKTIK